jgi:predicted Kef-type K+ transport protein
VDLISLLVAFVFGLFMRMNKLPPMLGFLIAGFFLKAFGFEATDFIREIADLGILLLLFSIGLKLDIKSIFRPEVIGTATLHMVVTIALISILMLALGWFGLTWFTEIPPHKIPLIAFALSFSSTVFAVKVFEEKGGINSLYGRIAIGVLIIQDLIAVVFMTFLSESWPSPWAFSLLLLPLLRPVMLWLLSKSGHGELLVLFGIFIAFMSSESFQYLGLKDDLGALVAGLVISNHKKSDELAKALLVFKDFFLIAFFLTIGLSEKPELHLVLFGAMIGVTASFKSLIFFYFLTRFKLRARTAFQSSLILGNYSEFALIVGYMAVGYGLLQSEWLLIFATAVAASFIISTPLNTHLYYSKFERYLRPFERPERLEDDEPIETGNARILIFGMGRVGTGAYDYMHDLYADQVLGLDEDWDVVQKHRKAGRDVILGDVLDSGFWEKLQPGKVDLVLLTLNNHQANIYAARRLRDSHYNGKVAATAHFEDEINELRELDVDEVFNIYGEAGSGFAEHVCQKDLLHAELHKAI